jgi:2-keto-3-deoxy-L-rhamnonate aldolase RhmA
VRPNPALERLRAGETVLGMFAIDFYSTGLARTATSAGAEFIVFDQEHTGWGLDQIRPLLAAARAS